MSKLLLAASAAALAIGLGAGTASATGFNWGQPAPKDPKDQISTKVTEKHEFENKVRNDWSWNKKVNEYVNIYADIRFKMPDLHELTQVSLVQKQVGDVTATTTIDTTVGKTYGHKASSLPIVLGSATAVGNMGSISLDKEPALLLNSDQIVMDIDGGKVNIDATADATVKGAAISLDATAVGNMLSINLPEPKVVVASIMQTNYADVSAEATLDQYVSGSHDYSKFSGLNPKNVTGGLLVNPPTMTGVIASVNATAVGNMASINTGSYASAPTGIGVAK